MSAVLGAVGFIVGGIVGWFAHVFVGDAVTEFRELRSQGYRAFLNNVDRVPIPPGTGSLQQRQAKREEMSKAKKELSDAAQALRTFKANNHRLSKMLAFFRYDIEAAANNLQNLSDHIDMENTAVQTYFDSYKDALNFPQKETGIGSQGAGGANW